MTLQAPLHVVQVGFFADPAGRSAAQLLDAWPTLADVAEAAERGGSRVSVVQASSSPEFVRRHGVDYHLLPFGETPSAVRRNAALRSLLRALEPDIFHVHGLDFPRQVLALAELAPGVPIILQDHASRPPRLWRRLSWRRGISAAAGISFCAFEQSQAFSEAGLLGRQTRVYEIPESTSRFVPGNRAEARRLSGLGGEPAVLWVGHLNDNKDPLTVLQGVGLAARSLPRLRLSCCFGSAPLLAAVRQRIAADPHLRDRVELLGRVPHERVEQLMRAADLFVLGSHHEGSGYSLIEALSCGLPPVVTDIPSFRSLTAGGTVGRLWRCGDPVSLCEALLAVARSADQSMRAAVQAHFERELSFEALGRKLGAMYADVLERRRRRIAQTVVKSGGTGRIEAV